MNCAQCSSPLPEGAATCPQCGATAGAPAEPPATGGPAPAPMPVASGAPAGAMLAGFNFNVERMSQVDKITGVASLVLLVSLFLPWYSVSAEGISISWSGMTGNSFLWLVFLLCLGIIGFLVLGAGFDELPFQLPVARDMILLIATAINLLLVLLAFFLTPGTLIGGVGWTFGAFIGLIAALVACAPLALPVVKAGTGRA